MAIPEISILKNLDFAKQLTFGYLACERVFPGYIYNSEKINFGNSGVLRKAMNFVYSSIFENDNIGQAELEQLLALVDKNIPSTENFPNVYGTIAMDCGAVIYESVNLLKKIETDRILTDISTTVTNIIDCFIQVRGDMDYGAPGFEEKILNDHIMQTEITLQRGIISYCTKIDIVTASDIETLLQLQNGGVLKLRV